MSRTYHQDYIARIRYSNNLPPPPGPPKLLDVPGTGLGNGRYTSANYATRIVRDQPLNIEIDAELGMHIDLVGLPGVFDGDESSASRAAFEHSLPEHSLSLPSQGIYALGEQPPVHPDDAPLLRSATALDKTTTTSGAKFLRRSEVLNATENAAKRKELIAQRANANGVPARKRQRVAEPPASKEDPANIVRDIEKGFELANQAAKSADPAVKPMPAQLQLWNKPVHPENAALTLLDSYPVLPDLDAVPDLGSYTVTKFQNNPLGGNPHRYDSRLDVAIIRPKDPPRDKIDDYTNRLAQHESDPDRYAHPGQPMFDYDLYLPENQEEAAAIKAQILEDATPDSVQNGDAEREPHAFSHIRMFETYQQAGDLNTPFGEVVAIALHDSDSGNRRDLAQGAYVYPIAQRTYIRGHRGQPSKFDQPSMETDKIHQIDLTLRPANDDEVALREKSQDMYGLSEPA